MSPAPPSSPPRTSKIPRPIHHAALYVFLAFPIPSYFPLPSLRVSFLLSPSNPNISQYILPKNPKPLAKRRKLSPGAERSLDITLRSARNPPLEIVLKAQSARLSVLELKNEVSRQASIPVEKIKVLYNKKPVGDAKVVSELVGEDDVGVEFGLMVMGGAASVVRKVEEVKEEVLPSTAVGVHGKDVLQMEEFWTDLKGFLTQRVRDEEEGEKLAGLFRKAWDAETRAS